MQWQIIVFAVLMCFCNFQTLFGSVISVRNDAVRNESKKSAESHKFTQLPPQCSSQIYCYGKLLHTVNILSVFNDSKTFVDMKMRFTETEILSSFDDFMNVHNQNPTRQELEKWVSDHFMPPGHEFENWSPSDWRKEPAFLSQIKDKAFNDWASNLNSFWKVLGRKMKQDVKDNEELYSTIYVPNPLIVPGGRFRELYYWDTFWIIRGLLYCEMYNTTKGILENYKSILERYDHIPNGGRVYYLGRSQPPFLTLMVKSYFDFTNDQTFVTEFLEVLEREFEFFEEHHTVVVNGHKMFRYIDNSSGPRPESYREDFITAEYFETEEEKEDFYSEMKAAAESGMDFTSRFFIGDDGTNQGTLVNIKTRSIIPVELNALMFRNAKIISEFYTLKGNIFKAATYQVKALLILKAINEVLWHDSVGAWLDYDLVNKRGRNYFSASNLSPLWFGAYNEDNSTKIASQILRYINLTGVDSYPGGVPNTLEHSGEQWDFPNVWPPMQYMLIMGLDRLGHEQTKQLAYNWTVKWITNNYLAYKDTKAMFEKYSAIDVGGHGGGGEYETQIGFGWSNGVVIELLAKYGDRLAANDHSHNKSPMQCVMSVSLVILCSFLWMISR